MPSDDSIPIPKFGTKQDGTDYIDRPGVYAVIQNHAGRVAIIKTNRGYFLPGGGIDFNESDIDALQREIFEEIGYQVTVLEKLGEAVEYIQAYSDEKNYRIHSKFYRAQLDAKKAEGVEKDHRLVWLLQENARKLLVRQSQTWAIQSMLNS